MTQSPYLDEQRHQDHDLNQPALDVQAVSVHYNATPALTDISFNLSRGERIAVIGPNGAGKSTLFSIISGVLKPTAGAGERFTVAQPDEHACIAYVSQRNHVELGLSGQCGRCGHDGPGGPHWPLSLAAVAEIEPLSMRRLSWWV